MQSVHEGHLASSRLSEQGESAQSVESSLVRTRDAGVLASILKGEASLNEKAISVLAGHLQNCGAQHVQLDATLEVAHGLLLKRQVKVIAGSGLSFWLVNLVEDLSAQMEGDSGATLLAQVVQLLTESISVLLVSLTSGTALHSVTASILSML